MVLSAGARLGRYEVLAPLGAGGSEVSRALMTGRSVFRPRSSGSPRYGTSSS